MPPAGSDDAPPAEARPADRRWLLVAVVVAAPILILIGALAQRTWYPTGDQAQAELRMLSMPEDPPLVGAAGRIEDEAGRQGNHPGPLMFWATWPLYELLGGSSWAFEASTGLVGLAWLLTSVWLVHRRAGPGPTAWWGAVALVLLGGFGLDGLTQPWNPWVSLFPFVVLVLATWSAVEGVRWMPPLAVAAGSYALQGHIGYLPVVAPLVLLALAAPCWWAWREREGLRRRLIPVFVAIDVGIVAWLGPIIDWATSDPSNVDKLVANFTEPSEPPIGLVSGIEAVLRSANPFGAWVWGGAEVAGSILPGLAFVVAWAVVAALVARTEGWSPLTRLNALLVALVGVGVVAVSRIFGALYLYTFRWITVLVALAVFTLGWGLVRLSGRTLPAAEGRPTAVIGVVLVALAVVMSVRLVGQEIPYDQSWRAEQAIAPKVADQLEPDQTYLVTWDDPAYLGGIGFGLILDLERRGFDVGAEPQRDAAVEPHRVLCPGDFDATILVATGEQTIARYQRDDDLIEIASSDPREDLESWQAAFDELLELRRAANPEETPQSLERSLNLLLLAPGQPDEVVDLASEVVLGGVPSAVFLDPADQGQDWDDVRRLDRTSTPC
ncbi:MAG: hypothetical protein KDA97_05600 [Acidimicrobiales bacterium]|nr:hypothetical protein [Acidimicrobiales bacterium]